MKEKETLEEVAESYADFSNDHVPICFGDKFNPTSKADFIAGAKWSQEQDKKMYIALETAISLLYQTTEYEVLDSWKEKVKELEQLINKI
jgi:enolase